MIGEDWLMVDKVVADVNGGLLRKRVSGLAH